MEPLLSVLAMILSVAALGSSGAPAADNLSSLRGKTIAVDPGHNGGNASDLAYINHKVPAGGFMKECDTTGAATDDESV